MRQVMSHTAGPPSRGRTCDRPGTDPDSRGKRPVAVGWLVSRGFCHIIPELYIEVSGFIMHHMYLRSFGEE